MYGVYVHVPWCRIHCPYCAFVVDTRRDPPHVAFIDAVLRAWSARRDAFPGRPETLYFGGGTPSLVPAAELGRVIRAVDPRGEVTVEVNPRTIDLDGLRALVDAGVTRASLGVQSFVATVARRLGRGHGVRDNARLVEHAARAGFRSLSIDLIFGAPRQSIGDWTEDLRRVTTLPVDHVSLYGLTLEPGTPFARAKVPAATDDEWREMYDLALERLGTSGLERYELSNYARPGHRSVHNEHYWRARHWCGIGPGAHGWRPDGARTADTDSVDAWMADPAAPTSTERPDAEALAFELIWSTLRHVDGLDRALLARWTGLDVDPEIALLRGGLLREEHNSLRLTDAGFAVSDAVAVRLAGSLRAAGGSLQAAGVEVR